MNLSKISLKLFDFKAANLNCFKAPQRNFWYWLNHIWNK